MMCDWDALLDSFGFSSVPHLRQFPLTHRTPSAYQVHIYNNTCRLTYHNLCHHSFSAVYCVVLIIKITLNTIVLACKCNIDAVVSYKCGGVSVSI